MNDKGVCRTALATQGLLNIEGWIGGECGPLLFAAAIKVLGGQVLCLVGGGTKYRETDIATYTLNQPFKLKIGPFMQFW